MTPRLAPVRPEIEQAARVKCALVSEGICPECGRSLYVPDRSVRWAVCAACSVAYRASGRGDDSFEWESRMVEHWSLDPLTASDAARRTTR